MSAPIRVERFWDVEDDDLQREIAEEHGDPFQPWWWYCATPHPGYPNGTCNYHATHHEAVTAGLAHLTELHGGPMTNQLPRRFHLQRDEDETGVSGTGRIADGVEFTDGTCVLRWLTARSSTAVYASLDDLDAIHGHGGKTRVVWIDPVAVDPCWPACSEMHTHLPGQCAMAGKAGA